MKKFIYITTIVTGLMLIINSCIKNMELKPIDPDIITADKTFDNPEAYTQFIAKCYAGLAVSGQQGPAGQPDISGIDEGFGEYLRGLWYHQEFPTDEAVTLWDDTPIEDFHFQQWTDGNRFTTAIYSRIFYQISLTNEFLRQTTEGKLNDRGTSEEWRTKIAAYRLEARWLRALSYWHALDLFGSVPFAVETDPVGNFFPPQISKPDLFNYIESELLDIEGQMMTPRTNEYGRVDQAATWMLLAKLYLNAKVYIQADKNNECITYCNKIIASPYVLAPTYQQLFWSNNGEDPQTTQEIIFPIRFDGQHTQTWGGTTFLVRGGIGGTMNPSDFGVKDGWGGTRTTRQLVEKFTSADTRGMFYTEGQNIDIINFKKFTDGYAITKFRNVYYTPDGDTIKGSSIDYPDTDFPMFRLADVYLMYAEAILRGGTGGSMGTAVGYINDLRTRAGAATVTEGDVNLDFILDERARELFWECQRRTDLIRFDKFTGGSYIWAWKGNTIDGRPTDAKYNEFPLPASDVNANPNLTQNPNY